MNDSPSPDFEPLTRTQILVAMGVTAVVLMIVAKLWLRFGTVQLLPVYWNPQQAAWGVGLSLGITLASSLLYRIWGAYRESAQFYLNLAISPLAWFDLIWLGLLPGMSEELLFRGVMLPAIGLNPLGLVLSSVLFGILHISGRNQWAYTTWATIVGLFLGLSAILTGNLLVPIIAHVITNWLSGFIWKWRYVNQ